MTVDPLIRGHQALNSIEIGRTVFHQWRIYYAYPLLPISTAKTVRNRPMITIKYWMTLMGLFQGHLEFQECLFTVSAGLLVHNMN